MMIRRLRVYRYDTRISKPADITRFCGCCFAKLVLSRGVPSVHGLWEAEPAFLCRGEHMAICERKACLQTIVIYIHMKHSWIIKCVCNQF